MRGRLVWWTVGATTAAILLMLGLREGQRAVSPGELSFAHSSAKSQCADCHRGAAGPPAQWLATFGSAAAAHDNSAGCLSCHNLGVTPHAAHSVPPTRLSEWTAAAQARTPTPARSVRDGELPVCADCHREHRGRSANLKSLSNAQCQTCHTSKFGGFTEGHPPFSTYPFSRRTRINFDHNSHLTRHFSEPESVKNAPRLCLDCHQPDVSGGGMLVKGFEAACAACHGPQVKGKGAVKAGFALISLPRFDDRALSAGYGIGEWPEDADQELSPFAKFLLAADPDVSAAIETLKGTDTGNLPKGDPAKLKAAQRLAWALKELILDLETKGQPELVARVEKTSGKQLTAEVTEAVAGMLSPEILKAAFGPYFPHLAEEVRTYREKRTAAETTLTPSPPAPKGGGKSVPAEKQVSEGGWFTTDGSFAALYRPTGHADRFLTAWLDLTVAAAENAASPAAAQLFNELSAPKAVGLCFKCHSAENFPTPAVQWRGARSVPTEHKVTRFSHKSHLSLLDNRGCQTCHELKEKEPAEAFAESFGSGKRDPRQYRSNFKTIEKAVCADCHKPGYVRDDCLLCHNYHVGRFGGVSRHTGIQMTPNHAAPN
jgi:Doubled CXXCH motif (Paired_CXXCH_1)